VRIVFTHSSSSVCWSVPTVTAAPSSGFACSFSR
jgi:hypothetical protein